jgi:hypothetical protein
MDSTAGLDVVGMRFISYLHSELKHDTCSLVTLPTKLCQRSPKILLRFPMQNSRKPIRTVIEA